MLAISNRACLSTKILTPRTSYNEPVVLQLPYVVLARLSHPRALHGLRASQDYIQKTSGTEIPTGSLDIGLTLQIFGWEIQASTSLNSVSPPENTPCFLSIGLRGRKGGRLQ